MSSAFTDGSNAFNVEKEALMSKVSKFKEELVSQEDIKYMAKSAEFRRTYDADVDDLKERLQKSKERADGLKAWADL